MRTAYKTFLLIMLTLVLTCGTKSADRINFKLVFSSAVEDGKFYSDENVTDVLYYIEDLTETERGSLIYPKTCKDNDFEPGCGFDKDDKVDLKLCFEQCGSSSSTFVPPGNNIKLVFCARNSEGKVIYKGESEQFQNDPEKWTGEISILICEAETPLSNCLESLPVECTP